MLHLVLKLITQIMQYILLICDRYSLKGAGGDVIYGLKLGLLKEILSVKVHFSKSKFKKQPNLFEIQ